jgi:uncharacterized C2H2 Zn-finger protein
LTTLSEDTLILNALTPGITDMSQVIDALGGFLSLKKQKDPSDRFNIILFQNSGPNYLNDFTLNPDNIIIALKSLIPTLAPANIAWGIFIAVSFIIDVFKRISHKAFRLIILTDEGTLKIPDQYIPVLNNLIEKVKDMPFFIDIVRINVEDPKEDKKLMDLASQCYGNVHRINDIRDLESILKVLALKRQIPEQTYYDEDKNVIPMINRPFYENLAEYPKDFDHVAECEICYQQDDENLVQCPRCKTIMHKSCLAQWSESSSIGIENVFRCFKCYNLLKFNKNYLKIVKIKKLSEAGEIKVEEIDLQKFEEKLEAEKQPEIIEAHDPLIPLTEQESNKEKKPEHLPRFFLCPHCSKMISNNFDKCPNCGYEL